MFREKQYVSIAICKTINSIQKLFDKKMDSTNKFLSGCIMRPHLEVPEEGFVGVIVLDEMSIQEDLQIEKDRSRIELIGFVNKGDEGNTCATLKAGTSEKKLVNHVVQFVVFF